MAESTGGIDVSFNAISIRDVQLTPLVEVLPEDLVSPILTGTTTQFLTTRAAARRMAERGAKCETGSATPKHIKPIPIPALNIMAIQVAVLNTGTAPL